MNLPIVYTRYALDKETVKVTGECMHVYTDHDLQYYKQIS